MSPACSKSTTLTQLFGGSSSSETQQPATPHSESTMKTTTSKTFPLTSYNPSCFLQTPHGLALAPGPRLLTYTHTRGVTAPERPCITTLTANSPEASNCPAHRTFPSHTSPQGRPLMSQPLRRTPPTFLPLNMYDSTSLIPRHPQTPGGRPLLSTQVRVSDPHKRFTPRSQLSRPADRAPRHPRRTLATQIPLHAHTRVLAQTRPFQLKTRQPTASTSHRNVPRHSMPAALPPTALPPTQPTQTTATARLQPPRVSSKQFLFHPQPHATRTQIPITELHQHAPRSQSLHFCSKPRYTYLSQPCH